MTENKKKHLPCPHCGAEWVPRKPNPLRCPRCWLPLKKVTKAEKVA